MGISSTFNYSVYPVFLETLTLLNSHGRAEERRSIPPSQVSLSPNDPFVDRLQVLRLSQPMVCLNRSYSSSMPRHDSPEYIIKSYAKATAFCIVQEVNVMHLSVSFGHKELSEPFFE